jgi:hypothetical protein
LENFDRQEIVFDEASDCRLAAKLVKRLKKEADAVSEGGNTTKPGKES